jgi:hypothetical protein
MSKPNLRARMIENARDAALDNALVTGSGCRAEAEEQAETLRRFLEQQPVMRLDAEAAES